MLGGRFVYRRKRGSTGEVVKHKARWVVKGFEQRWGIDYGETFAAVVRSATYRLLLALAVLGGWQVTQHDFVTAFLNPPLDTELYMELPPEIGKPGQVAKLLKTLYGLKQSPRLWFEALARLFASLGFSQLPSEPSIFTGSYRGAYLIVAVYVDDLLIFGPQSSKAPAKLAKELGNRFQLTHLGPISYFLGIKVYRDPTKGCMHLSQEPYVRKLLEAFELTDAPVAKTPMEAGQQLTAPVIDQEKLSAEETTTYQQLVGSMMYLMTQTRPDIAVSVGILSRALAAPTRKHLTAATRVLLYLKGTSSQGIIIRRHKDLYLKSPYDLLPHLNLLGYVDSEYAGDISTRKSTGGYIFTAAGAPISWASRRQQIVTLSSTEAEYVALTEATQEALWLRRILEELRLPGKLTTVPLFNDNMGAAALAKNPEYRSRTKHIEVRWHWIREVYQQGWIELPYIATKENLADGFTKPLGSEKFYAFSNSIVGEPPT